MESDQYNQTFEFGGLSLWKISCYEECDIPKAKKRSTMDNFSKSNETKFVPKIPKSYSSTFVPKPSKYFTKSEPVSVIKKDVMTQTKFEPVSVIKKDVMTRRREIRNHYSCRKFFGSEKLNWNVIMELCPICRSNNRKNQP